MRGKNAEEDALSLFLFLFLSEVSEWTEEHNIRNNSDKSIIMISQCRNVLYSLVTNYYLDKNVKQPLIFW